MVNFTYLIIVLITVFLSMVLHEVAHAYAGYWLGDDTAKIHGRLSFNPIKHIDPFLTIILPLMLALIGAPIFGGAKPVPYNPYKLKFGEWGSLLVAIAGPLTNLLIAFTAFGISVSFGSPAVYYGSNGIFDLIISTIVGVNLGFFVFNMIPIPPLDGSRVLYTLAPDFVRSIMDAIENAGVVVVFGLILLTGSFFNSFIYSAIIAILYVFAGIFGL